MKPSYCYNAELIRVVDGDTVVLSLDVGFDTHILKTCRLLGINAPERSTPTGPAATAYLAQLLAPHAKALVVTTTKPDKYGRSLVKIYLPNQDADASQQMLSAGHAVPFMVDT